MNCFIKEEITRKLKENANEYSPLVLAYIGDSVYEVYVRAHLLSRGNCAVHKLHKQATGLVCAKAQSELMQLIEAQLTEEELAVYKRGRNTKSGIPKNADMQEYRRATGFEALIGYLYVNQNMERISELLWNNINNTEV